MQRLRQRRKAAGLKAVVSWVGTQQATFSSHRILEARSLAMHALIAAKIERDPSLLEIPMRNLERWERNSDDATPHWIAEWRNILQQPWPAIAALITEQSENAVRLRQSSPFAGVLTDEERRRIYAAFRDAVIPLR
jgi:hypothetical protein